MWLEQATWQALQETMQQGPWHPPLYRGMPSSTRAWARALAMTGDGTAWLLSADASWAMLADQRSLRLADAQRVRARRRADAFLEHRRRAGAAWPARRRRHAIRHQPGCGGRVHRALLRRWPTACRWMPVSEGAQGHRPGGAGRTVEWGTPVLFSHGRRRHLADRHRGGRHPERCCCTGCCGRWSPSLWSCWALPAAWPGPCSNRCGILAHEGNFNIAVADIGVIQPGGAMRVDAGKRIGAELYHSLDDAYTARRSGPAPSTATC